MADHARHVVVVPCRSLSRWTEAALGLLAMAILIALCDLWLVF